jgi:hypothetical protein
LYLSLYFGFFIIILNIDFISGMTSVKRYISPWFWYRQPTILLWLVYISIGWTRFTWRLSDKRLVVIALLEQRYLSIDNWWSMDLSVVIDNVLLRLRCDWTSHRLNCFIEFLVKWRIGGLVWFILISLIIMRVVRKSSMFFMR